MRNATAALLSFLLTFVTVIPASGQTGDDPEFPDGEWVGRFQTLTTTPRGFSRTVVHFTVETSGGAGVSGEVTSYAAASENTETDGEFSATAAATVIDHHFSLDVGQSPPTFSGTHTWRWDVKSKTRVGVLETDIPDETLPASWPMAPRAVSCTSVSARGGGGDDDQRFRTELVALRTGGSDVLDEFVALIGVIEEQLDAGDLAPLQAAELLIAVVAMLRQHNDELAALAACEFAIPGVGEIDPLRALLEPLLQRLLAVVREGAVDPAVFPPQLLLKVLSAAFEGGGLGPHAVNQVVAEQLEEAFELSVMIIAVEWAEENGDVSTLQDLQIAGALFGWHGVVSAAEMALQNLLAPPVTLP